MQNNLQEIIRFCHFHARHLARPLETGDRFGYNFFSLDPEWPTVADLHVEDDGKIFVLCHGRNGGQFMNALIEHLETLGHAVTVDDV